jgi:DNA-binding XRE family transcriptional regulator
LRPLLDLGEHAVQRRVGRQPEIPPRLTRALRAPVRMQPRHGAQMYLCQKQSAAARLIDHACHRYLFAATSFRGTRGRNRRIRDRHPERRAVTARSQSIAAQRQFGANLRRERKAARHTQMSLALECDIHWTHIGRLERGERDPQLSTIVRLATGLHIPAARLLDPMNVH